jgi:hypothetical protein
VALFVAEISDAANRFLAVAARNQTSPASTSVSHILLGRIRAQGGAAVTFVEQQHL